MHPGNQLIGKCVLALTWPFAEVSAKHVDVQYIPRMRIFLSFSYDQPRPQLPFNRQGADAGDTIFVSQSIYYHDNAKGNLQAWVIKEVAILLWRPISNRKFVHLETFYEAEQYHSDYYRKQFSSQGYCVPFLPPKLSKAPKNACVT